MNEDRFAALERELRYLRDRQDILDCVVRTSRAFRNCWIEANRSAGSFAMARRIAVSIALGTVCLTTRRLGTGSARCRAMTACVVGPVNGG